MMTFKIAQREIKNNFRYWLLFAINLSIGLLGFTFILLFRNNINSALEQRAKNILSSDIAVTGRRALAQNEKKEVDSFLSGKIKQKSQMTEIYSMARALESKKSRLLFIKAIEENFPLIGKIELKKNKELSSSVFNELRKNEVLITKEVSHQFKIDIGDTLKIGEQNFNVLDIINSDTTTSMRGMSLAPKVYIAKENLKSTGLIKFGSVAWYTDFYLINKNQEVSVLQKGLEGKIKDPAISVRTPTTSGQQIGRVLNYLSDYLGLIGVVALLISSIGSTYLFQNYIYSRLQQIGVLKSIGLSSRKITISFCLVVIFFGAFSSILALILSRYFLPFALSYVSSWIVIDLDYSISYDVILSVIGIGLGTNILICIPVLRKLFLNKTILLLNESVNQKFKAKDILLYLPAMFFVWGISVWQAHSFKIGTIFFASISFIFLLILLILPIFLRFAHFSLIGKLVSWPISLSFGYGTRLFVRNRISTILTVLSLSVGVSLLSLVGQIDTSLKSELTDSRTEKPSLFLFDVQDDQINELLKLGEDNDIPFVSTSPMIRGKLISKNGEKVTRKQQGEGFQTREEETQRRFNNRGINLSYAKSLKSSEKIVEGREFYGEYSGEGDVELSLEKRYAQRLGVGLGDKLTYDVLGVEVKGVVVNLRSVKWTSFVPNFFIVMQPGVLEVAPKTFLTAVKKVSEKRRLEIQDIIVDKFSNISILNVSDIITKVLSLFKAMAWAINLMSLCCVIVGLFVLFSILQGQLIEKEEEFALQKIMGMSSHSILKTIMTEYLMMVFLSLFFGNFVGVGLSYLISYIFLDGVFVFNTSFALILNFGLLFLSMGVIYITFKSKYHKKINHLLYD